MMEGPVMNDDKNNSMKYVSKENLKYYDKHIKNLINIWIQTAFVTLTERIEKLENDYAEALLIIKILLMMQIIEFILFMGMIIYLSL